jgi:hypothetical protein
MTEEIETMCDKEVAALLKISPSCLRKQLRNGPAKTGSNVIDLRLAEPVVIAGMRRWSKRKVLDLLK